MICPECGKEGRKSRVYVGVSSSTLLMGQQFYDEEGEFHSHDPNTTSTDYSCSNGHKWSEKKKHSCWCGWPDEERVDEDH